MGDDTWTGAAVENERTRVHGFGDGPSSTPGTLGARESFLVAYERLSLLAGAAPAAPVVVAAVDPRARVIGSLALEDRGALVIGRHTECGLHLGADTVSLRHVAGLACREQGRSVVRLWDLDTGRPFVTEDGQPNEAVIADGPLYVAVDRYALWILPTAGPWPARADDAWSSLPQRSFVDRRPARADAPFRHRTAPPSARVPLETDTTVTRVGPPLLLAEDDAPEIAWGEIRLARGDARERRNVSAERLERGLLLGRYERCGLALAASTAISRVHLLLVRIGGDVWAIDTASTNGTYRDKKRLGAAVLADSDSLTLSDEVTLDWAKATHPEA